MEINKNSPIPLYYQLAEILHEQIASGELKPGEQIPTERELCEKTGISRVTVRQAIAYLIRDGLLVARSGKGTFVAEPKFAYDPLHLLGFTEEMMQKGAAATSRVLEKEVVTPPAQVAAGLHLSSSATTVKIVRLRLSEGIPLLLETVYLPSALCPGLEQEDLADQSLYALLESKYGLRLSHARQTLEPTIANQYEAEMFGIPIGTGMILLQGVTFTDSNRPVEYFKAIYRGDRFKFELESRRTTWALELPNATRLNVVFR
jgi:GntR family transcriptional regulator